MEKFDVIIIGGGPAGYTAALYCARAALSAVVLEWVAPGGQMGTTDQVDNYPGFEEGVNGFDLAVQMQKQAERFGAQSRMGRVERVSLTGEEKTVVMEDGTEFSAPCAILATGAAPRELGLPEERGLRGHGVSYCATCDGMFYRGKTVAVVGGGDTAAADALFLSKICKKVYLVHRRDSLRASKAYTSPLEDCENIEFIWNATVERIEGESKVSGIMVKDKISGEEKPLACDGVFIAVGNIPRSELFQGQVTLTPDGYVDAGEDTKTNLPGVFAAGDLRRKPLRQIVTAVADGAVAAYLIEHAG